MSETENLSRREKEILGELVRGKSNRQIAAALGISLQTVKNQLRNIYASLGVESCRQLIPMAPELLKEFPAE